jgi:hypothetical protein
MQAYTCFSRKQFSRIVAFKRIRFRRYAFVTICAARQLRVFVFSERAVPFNMASSPGPAGGWNRVVEQGGLEATCSTRNHNFIISFAVT